MKRSFTLIEIMIVTAIIALLSAVVVPVVMRSRLNASDSVAKGAIRSTAVALETYLASEGAYPDTVAALLESNPKYIDTDFFNGTPSGGYTFSVNFIDADDYSLSATPVSCGTTGSKDYTVSTGIIVSVSECV